MPYKKDPRGRATANLPPEEFAALRADATQAGYSTPGRYVLALVRARGAAPRPVLDENGAQRVARMRGKLDVVNEALAACQAARQKLLKQLRALEMELAQRPTLAEQQQQQITEAIAKAFAEQDGAALARTPTPEEAARAARRQARRDKE